MRNLQLFLSATVSLLMAQATGCSSADTVAAGKAAEAQADLAQGRIPEAVKAIGKAIAARDDILEYWLLKAHIDIKADDRGSAFGDYEFALQLDHTNMEALQALCQLGLSVGPPDAIEKYADQLLMLTPDSILPLIAKGGVALGRGDKDAADVWADRVLVQDPQNLAALTLKARIMIARGRFAEAAVLIEKTPETAANTRAKLTLLKDVYTRADNRPAYQQTIRRLATSAPNDPYIQLDYADLLYQEAQNDQARAIIEKVMSTNPGKLQVAIAALKVLREAGPQALDTGKMVADAAPLSPLMKADFAQFANETGHPDIAMAILRGADRGDPTPDNSNAKAALAYAIGMKGNIPLALDQLNTILSDDHDPNQPWGLLARARLFVISHDYVNAVRDARLLVTNDPESATARLALADILTASGSTDLSQSALREGLNAIPSSVRIAARLAATLTMHGGEQQATQITRELLRSAPMNLRAMHLAQSYGM